MLPASSRLGKRTSPLWKVFELHGPDAVKCSICGIILSFKSFTGNLQRHLISKHRGVYDAIVPKRHPKTDGATAKAVKQLIGLVEKHPCIWDTRSESYGDVAKQNESWSQIAFLLHPNEKQSQVIDRLSRKFNALRSKFFSNGRPSMYYRSLSFLGNGDKKKQSIADEVQENVIDNSETNEDCVSDTKEEDRESNNHEEKFQPIHCSQQGSKELPSLEPGIHLHITSAEEDNLFLLSLADEMNRVPVEFDMCFKSELLMEFNKLINKYKNDC